ncbi:MAG: YggS family pyridoxal phosphate-dependent enzyme [Muribaculaceae bacterium]|nr:YggS family pyridoxal phosphate-dependent enzyme [Muribaculaceae bacterium]
MKSNIAAQLLQIKAGIPAGVQLVAVSKFHPAEAIKEAYDAGQRIFGESRAQELKQKFEVLPTDIQWHFIGHLQTNKVRMLMPMVSLFHSVDSLHLMEVIDAEAHRIGTVANILLQVHVAREETKFGFSPEEIIEIINAPEMTRMHNISVHGIMGMASNTDHIPTLEAEFNQLAGIFHDIKSRNIFPDFNILSMGMSQDYQIAIQCGSNMIRIGTDIFGNREY